LAGKKLDYFGLHFFGNDHGQLLIIITDN